MKLLFVFYQVNKPKCRNKLFISKNKKKYMFVLFCVLYPVQYSYLFEYGCLNDHSIELTDIDHRSWIHRQISVWLQRLQVFEYLDFFHCLLSLDKKYLCHLYTINIAIIRLCFVQPKSAMERV